MKIDNFCEGWLGREDAQLNRAAATRFENIQENRRDKHVSSMRVQYPASQAIEQRDFRDTPRLGS